MFEMVLKMNEQRKELHERSDPAALELIQTLAYNFLLLTHFLLYNNYAIILFLLQLSI